MYILKTLNGFYLNVSDGLSLVVELSWGGILSYLRLSWGENWQQNKFYQGK